MTNFLAIVDDDAARRRRTIRRAEDDIAPVAGLRVDTCRAGSFETVWAADPEAPVTSKVDASGCSIIWGEAIAPGESRRIDAGRLKAAWEGGFAAPTWDGYYAALRYRAGEGLVAGVDLLGLFPLYYCRAARDVVLLASSPTLLQHHPQHSPALDLRGLAGLLVTGGPVKGRTLQKQVRRLEPGHALHWTPGAAPTERQQFTLEPSDAPGRSSCLLEELHECLRAAVARHLGSDTDPVLLLSGGRDSRLLLGTAREVGSNPVCLTFGRPDDYEFQCARAAARKAGVGVVRAEYPANRYGEWAVRSVKWEQLASSFAAMYTWGTHEPLRRLGSRVLSGHLLELVLGGIQEQWVRDAEGRATFETFFRRMNGHAVPVGVLEDLIRRPELLRAVDDIVAEIRESFHSSEYGPSRYSQLFLFRHWGRFHPGSAPWRFSFGAWPVLPVLDRRLLTLGISLPPEAVTRRRAEDALIRSRYPALASAPLDRNSARTRPLAPDLRWRAEEAFRRLLDRIPLPSAMSASDSERERRFYHRIYDLGGPGWRAVRRRAEPYRDELSDLFHSPSLRRYLPPPSTVVRLDNPIVDAFGRKTLLGLMLWMAADAA